MRKHQYIPILVILIIALLTLSACGFDTTSLLGEETSTAAQYTKITEEISEFDFRLHYNLLTQAGKDIYDSTEAEVRKGASEVVINTDDCEKYYDNTEIALEAFLLDNPEYFWLDGSYEYSESHSKLTGKGSITITFGNYTLSDSENRDECIEKFNGILDKITNSVKNEPDTFSKVKAVHDYIIENTVYDFAAIEESDKDDHSPEVDCIYSAYGCLVNNKAVCAGYAHAFQVIMLKLGINCTYISGTDEMDHAWNQVEIDNNYYNIDVTWDDPDAGVYGDNSIELTEPEYSYFCVPDEIFNKTHEAQTSVFEAQKCASDKYNYFVYNGFRLDEYDFEEAQRIIEAQREHSAIGIAFTSENALADAVEDLIDNSDWEFVDAFSDIDSLRYYRDTDNLLLYMYK